MHNKSGRPIGKNPAQNTFLVLPHYRMPDKDFK